MRFHTIALEGPDCAGKTTFIEEFHNKTGYSHHIIDRHYLSPFIYSRFYNRSNKSNRFNLFMNSLKSFNTLYVILLPSKDVILERFLERGDDIHTQETILETYDMWYETCKYFLRNIPNVLVLENIDINSNITAVIDRITALEFLSGDKLVKDLVLGSGRHELNDLNIVSRVIESNLNRDVLNFPKEKEYYKDISEKFQRKIAKETIGLNEYNLPQKSDSRRFVYTDDSCISLIQLLFRDNEVTLYATLRSSNVITTLWADYEFLKILAFESAKDLKLTEYPIYLNLTINSAHLVS